MEEVEWISTGHSVFKDYIEIVEKLLESQSNNLYIGPLLDGLEDTEAMKRRAGGVRRLSVENRRAAAMFYLNLLHWRSSAFVLENYPSGVIDRLERSLDNIRNGPGRVSEIEWGLRQVVFEKI